MLVVIIAVNTAILKNQPPGIYLLKIQSHLNLTVRIIKKIKNCRQKRELLVCYFSDGEGSFGIPYYDSEVVSRN